MKKSPGHGTLPFHAGVFPVPPGFPVRVSGRKLLPEFIHPLLHILPGGLLISEVTAIVVPLEIIVGVTLPGDVGETSVGLYPSTTSVSPTRRLSMIS